MKLYENTYPVEITINQKGKDEPSTLNMVLTESQFKKVHRIKDKGKQILEVLKIAKEKGLISNKE